MIPGADATSQIHRGWLLHSTLPRPPVGQTAHVVIHRHDKLVVRYYAPTGESVCKTPVVLVPSLINRAYILDLEPDRSVVGALSALGHPVYLVDWGVPCEEDSAEDTGYMLHELLSRSMDRICRHARQPRALVLGYCQGGVLAAMLAALAPERFAGLVLLNSPFRFSEGGRFRDLVAPEFMDVDQAMPDGLVSVDAMQAGFKLLDPMGNWTKYLAVEKASGDPARMARVLARERWLEENVPLPAVFAREFIRNAYQKDALLDGGWVIRGQEVDLRNIICPVLVIASERDFIAPKEACLPVAEATGSDDVTVQVIPTGHIGCVVGSAAAQHLFPLLDGWFRRVQP
ncbi:MAG: polyhydroxyalkanoate synthase [Myxococcota bacterium]